MNGKRTVLIAVLVCILLAGAASRCYGGEKDITVVFRFDDYSALSSTETEIRLIEAFAGRGASFTVGVIPYICAGDIYDTRTQDVVPLPAAKMEILRDAVGSGVVDPALHGYSHQAIGPKSSGVGTEFAGLDLPAQTAKIAAGKKYLEEGLGIPISTFIPPWNTYDSNTLRAAEGLGFEIFSADTGVAGKASRLIILPRTTGIKDLEAALQWARRIPDPKPLIVVLFHEYDFIEADAERGYIRYADFERILGTITSQRDVRLRSVREAAESYGGLSAGRFAAYNKYMRLRLLEPPLLKGLFPSGVYMSTGDAGKVTAGLAITLILFYTALSAAVSFAVYSAGTRLMRGRPPFIKIFACSTSALAIALFIYALRDLDLHYKGAAAIAVSCGLCAGAWILFLKWRKG